MLVTLLPTRSPGHVGLSPPFGCGPSWQLWCCGLPQEGQTAARRLCP